MKRYAEATAVPIARSRAEIDRLLREWGADGIQWSDDFRQDRVTLRFLWSRLSPDRKEAREYLARIDLQLPSRESLAPEARDGRTGRVSEAKLGKILAERGKREHRVLLLWLKAALNAVDVGIIEAEAIFLPFLEGKDGQTVAEVAVPRMGFLLTGGADRLLIGPGEAAR